MDENVLALVGATGGAGTTRLSLEVVGTLARVGHSVAVVDAAYATQGLAMAVKGPIDPDVTGVLTRDRALERAQIRLDLDAPGEVVVAPSRAPFERLARAKTSECARRLAGRLATAAQRRDAVIVDVPPVAANQAVAAVTAADRVGLVAPDSERGADALVAARDRLHDVDAPVDATISMRADESAVVDAADVSVPTAAESALDAAPTSHRGTDEFAASVAAATEALLDVELDLEFDDERLLPL